MNLAESRRGGAFDRQERPSVIVLIDDHPLVHLAVRELISRCTAHVQLRCFRSVTASLPTLRADKPALVLMDLVLPDLCKREAVQVVRRAAPRALLAILSDDAVAALQVPEVANGVVAFLDKSWHPDDTGRALAALIERCGLHDVPCLTPPANSLASLSPRQHAILRLLATGGTNQAIANALHVSPETVKTHLSEIFSKLRVKNRTQAVLMAQLLQSSATT